MTLLKKSSLILFLFVSVTVLGQTEKGGFLVSGGLSGSSSKVESGSPTFDSESKQSTIALHPRVGYFLIDHFLVGLSLPLAFGENETKIPYYGEWKSRHWSIGIGPFLRYYIPVNEKLFFLTEASYSRVFSKYINTSEAFGEIETKGTAIQFAVGAGLAYFINKNIATELMASYNRYREDEAEYYSKNSSIAIEVGF